MDVTLSLYCPKNPFSYWDSFSIDLFRALLQANIGMPMVEQGKEAEMMIQAAKDFEVVREQPPPTMDGLSESILNELVELNQR